MISIIIPVYNARKWLKRCIDSVLAQSCESWELLLIDDGSTDGSEAICDSYSGADSRIRVIHKKNGGVSSARNEGIRNASYEWITFMDSDDCIGKDAIRCYIETINAQNACLYNFRYYFHYDTGNVEFIRGGINGMLDIDSANSTQMYHVCCTLWHVWDNLYSKTIIKKHQLSFNENTKLGEDQMFNLHYILHCKRIYFSDKGFYQYFWAHSPQSLTFAKQSPEERASYAIEKYSMYQRLNADKREAKKIYYGDVMYSLRIALQTKRVRDVIRILVTGNTFKNELWFTRNIVRFALFSMMYKIRLLFKQKIID